MKVRRTVKMNVSRYEVGDVIRYKLLNGEKHEAMAMKQDGDNMIFQQVNCLENKYRMNPTDRSKGGWEETELRGKLNGEIINLFPDKLLRKMIAFDNGDILTLTTEKEMFGENKYGEDEGNEVAQWEPMKNRKNRISLHGDNETLEWVWLKTKTDTDSASHFAYVDLYGYATNGGASASLGVRPVFRIKNMSKSEKVSDEWLLEDEIPE